MTKAKKVTIAVLGSFIEWYDFALIGALSKYINSNFFDKTDPIGGLVHIFLIFAVGYLARPFGALFFGYCGDQYGRQMALRLSLILVSSATLSIGCLPTTHELGGLATIGLVVLRFIQGFGSGGEHAGGILLLYEDQTEKSSTRANYAIIAIMCGLFFGFFSAYMLQIAFAEAVIEEWAWRVPFIFGGVIGIFGVVLRMNMTMDMPFKTALSGLEHYKKFFIDSKRQFFVASGIYIHSVAIFYANYFFYPSYIEQNDLIASSIINEIRVIMAVVFIALFVLLGRRLNREDSYSMFKISSLSTILLIFPLHYIMVNYGVCGYAISTAVLTVLNVIYLLPIAGLLSGLFDRNYRYTGVSLSINIVSSLFGGTAPLLLTFLVGYFHSFIAGGMYLFLTAMIGYLTINWLSRNFNGELVYVKR